MRTLMPAGTPTIDGVDAPLLLVWSAGQTTRVHAADPARVWTQTPAIPPIPPRMMSGTADTQPQPIEEEPIEEELPFEDVPEEEPVEEPEATIKPASRTRTARS